MTLTFKVIQNLRPRLNWAPSMRVPLYPHTNYELICRRLVAARPLSMCSENDFPKISIEGHPRRKVYTF